MKLKAILRVAVVCVLTLCLSITSFATEIFVDLQEVKTDVAPQIINNRTMVPVRAIAEMVGCRVEWIADKQQVEVYDPTSKALIIVMQIDNTIANYTKYDPELKESVGVEYVMDSPPVIINNRTFVPLRFISEAIGYTVDYNVDNGNIYLFSPAYINNQIGEGKGMDDGEGIGETKLLTDSEISYVLSFNTKSWLDLTDTGQDYVVSLIARWWDLVDGYVVSDFDALKQELTHQMETYFRNKVDASLFETACDIRGIDPMKYLKSEGTGAGEGIGETKPLTDSEISYVLSFNTQSWLDLTEVQKDDVVSLIARWWDSVDGYVVPDFDALKQDLTHQMETYSRNKVDANLFETACDIRGIDPGKYLKPKV